MEDQIYCEWELASFPSSQFQNDPEYGLVHEHPPLNAPRHTTSGEALPTDGGRIETWQVPSSIPRPE
jgi:hypothetical protein